jgi:ParB family chromosome partitioning protein
MTTLHILWSDLVATKRNVRKVKTGIESLAASMASEDGQIQNLVVVAREDGKYEVIVGERRRRAAVHNVKTKVWGRDATMRCELRDGKNATSISYAENAERENMHPADAIRAFATLRDEGYTEEAIANLHLYDLAEVRRMLALASLSPKVINALALNKIDVTCAQAFTLTDDHKRQERILKRYRTAHEVRRALTETKVTTGHRLFRFVGMDAYRAAQGTITGDLFSTKGEGYADEPELVQRLADEKLDALAAEAEAEGWGEVIAAEHSPHDSYKWDNLYPDQRTQILSDADEVLMDELQEKRDARIAELVAALGENFEPQFDADVRALEAQINQIGTVERSFSDEAKANGRLLIVIGHDGAVKRTPYARKTARGGKQPSTGTAGTSAPRPLYDARMTEELSRMRTVALQVEVAKNQHLANAVLLDALLPILANRVPDAHAIQLRASKDIEKPAQHFDYNTREMASPYEGVADLMPNVPKKAANRFAWVLAQNEADIARLLAACTAALIDGRHGKYADPKRLRSVDRIARAANLDMREHWEGGVEFFGAISKKAMLAALNEACNTAAAENCAKMPKGELAQACAERIPGRGWLPPALVTPEEPEAEPEEQEVEDDEEGEGEGDEIDAEDSGHEDDAPEAEGMDDSPFADADNDDDEYLAIAAE